MVTGRMVTGLPSRSVKVPPPESCSRTIVVSLDTVAGCPVLSTTLTRTVNFSPWRIAHLSSSGQRSVGKTLVVTGRISRALALAALAGIEIPTVHATASRAVISTARERRTGGIMGNAFPWEIFMLRQRSTRKEKFTQIPGARLVTKDSSPVGVPLASLLVNGESGAPGR